MPLASGCQFLREQKVGSLCEDCQRRCWVSTVSPRLNWLGIVVNFYSGKTGQLFENTIGLNVPMCVRKLVKGMDVVCFGNYYFMSSNL